ncbi:MAG: geranylgeranylglycerol-phosphate geranylgeranyltransferase [Methanoregula sp.]|nr:MAG: geranylgeranylglycerol-phosphate geranylgeranyltransferase [Methanoregula sp.]
MSLQGYIAITRPLNAVVSGLAAALGYLIATGTLIPATLILIPIVILITAAGNVINDYFDADIDAINRPRRPIPSGEVTRTSARSYAIILFLAGVLLSLFTNPLCIAIAIFNSLLLIAYAGRLKRVPVSGNIAVSCLAASIFLFGGAFAGIGGLVRNLPLGTITFFAMMARELLKDAEDVKGDAAGGARTLPMNIGIRSTGRIAFSCGVIAICVSLLPGLWWGSIYVAGIGFVDLFILAGISRVLPCETPACVTASRATTMLKAGMFASLIVFALAAVFMK